jgi:biotin transporter BioY
VTSPWEDPGLDPAVLRILERRTPEVRHEPSLLRDPARVLIVAGGVLAIVASPLPWLVKVGGGTARTMTGWSGLADGFLVAVVAAAMIAAVLNGDVARSRAWMIRWIAPMLGVVAVVLGISALRNMENQIEIWSIEGATGDHQSWL